MNISYSFWLLATEHASYYCRENLPHSVHITEAENARYLFSQPPLQLECRCMIQTLPMHLFLAVNTKNLIWQGWWTYGSYIPLEMAAMTVTLMSLSRVCLRIVTVTEHSVM